MTLMLVARGQHAAVGAVVLAESVVNLCLSIVLVNAIGPIGPAISTLVVIGTNDLVVIPLLASSRLQIRPLAIWSKIATGFMVGGTIVAASLLIPVAEAVHVIARVGFESALLAAFLWYALRPSRGKASKTQAEELANRK
jgi:O-antigen/teichoic acid export membrane protein